MNETKITAKQLEEGLQDAFPESNCTGGTTGLPMKGIIPNQSKGL